MNKLVVLVAAALVEGLLLVELGVFGYVPVLTLSLLVWYSHNSQPRRLFIGAMAAGLLLDSLRSGSSPWIFLGILVGAGAALMWRYQLRVYDRAQSLQLWRHVLYPTFLAVSSYIIIVTIPVFGRVSWRFIAVEWFGQVALGAALLGGLWGLNRVRNGP